MPNIGTPDSVWLNYVGTLPSGMLHITCTVPTVATTISLWSPWTTGAISGPVQPFTEP